jgi:O-glycosyl hydrolase
MSWLKGSKWRKWDLHVHSPASHAFAGDWNQFIIQLGNADCDVVGINDYFSVAGHKEVQRRLLVVSNTGNFPKSFAVKYHGKFFQTALPAESVGTYVW